MCICNTWLSQPKFVIVELFFTVTIRKFQCIPKIIFTYIIIPKKVIVRSFSSYITFFSIDIWTKIVIASFEIWRRDCFHPKTPVGLSGFSGICTQKKYAVDNILEIVNTFSDWRKSFFHLSIFMILKLIIQRKNIFFKPKCEDV